MASQTEKTRDDDEDHDNYRYHDEDNDDNIAFDGTAINRSFYLDASRKRTNK